MNAELALNLLAEVSATEISRSRQPEGFSQPKEVPIVGGKIVGDARKALEEQFGHSVLSETNVTTPELLDDTENKKELYKLQQILTNLKAKGSIKKENNYGYQNYYYHINGYRFVCMGYLL